MKFTEDFCSESEGHQVLRGTVFGGDIASCILIITRYHSMNSARMGKYHEYAYITQLAKPVDLNLVQ